MCGQVLHRQYKRILWPFMLAVSLEMFYITTQKDTGKLKSFLSSRRKVNNGESLFSVLNR